MPGSSNDTEVENVLTAIRRLIQEGRPEHQGPLGRLVLTPAQRVEEPAPALPIAPEPLVLRDAIQAAATAPPAAEPAPLAPLAPPADFPRLVDESPILRNVLEAEAAASRAPTADPTSEPLPASQGESQAPDLAGPTSPDPVVVPLPDAQHRDAEATSGPLEASLGDDQPSDPADEPAELLAGPQTSGPVVPPLPEAQHPIAEASDAEPLPSTDLEPAPLAFGADTATPGPVAPLPDEPPFLAESLAPEPLAAPPDGSAASLDATGPAALGAVPPLPEPEPAAPEAPSPEALPPLGDEPASLLPDEAALRALVARVLHEELRGELGERITQNLRQLVRREVQQALAGRDGA